MIGVTRFHQRPNLPAIPGRVPGVLYGEPVHHAFEVERRDGSIQAGRPGDFLALAVDNELFILSKEQVRWAENETTN